MPGPLLGRDWDEHVTCANVGTCDLPTTHAGPCRIRAIDWEARAAKLQKILRNMMGKHPEAGFVAVLIDRKADGSTLVSSFGDSRSTARILREAANKLDGGRSDV